MCVVVFVSTYLENERGGGVCVWGGGEDHPDFGKTVLHRALSSLEKIHSTGSLTTDRWSATHIPSLVSCVWPPALSLLQ